MGHCPLPGQNLLQSSAVYRIWFDMAKLNDGVASTKIPFNPVETYDFTTNKSAAGLHITLPLLSITDGITVLNMYVHIYANVEIPLTFTLLMTSAVDF